MNKDTPVNKENVKILMIAISLLGAINTNTLRIDLELKRSVCPLACFYWFCPCDYSICSSPVRCASSDAVLLLFFLFISLFFLDEYCSSGHT